MCGLIYGRSKNSLRPINKFIIKQFEQQKNRGLQGFGLYDVEQENIVKETQEKNIMRWIRKHPTSEILFHHRLPTSTSNTKDTAHPFSTKDFFSKEYILIHNGIINNSYELARGHNELGITYWSTTEGGRFNDSEALLWDFALFKEKNQSEMKAKGSMAFICIEKDRDTKAKKLYYYHNSANPLYKRETKKFFMLSSEDKEMNGNSIPINTLYCYDYDTEITESEMLIVPSWYSNYDKNYSIPKVHDYEHKEYEEDEDYENMRHQLSLYEDEQETQIQMLKDHNQLAKDIRKTCIDYLNMNEGYYELTLLMMEEEIEKLDKENYSVETWYRKELLRGACAVLLVDPKRTENGAGSIHPLFMVEERKTTPTIIEPSSTFQAAPPSVMANQADKNTRLDLEDNLNSASLIRNIIIARSNDFKDMLNKHHKVPSELTKYQIPDKEAGLVREIPIIS